MFRPTPLLALRGSDIPQPAFGSWITASTGTITQPAGAPITFTLGNACVSGNDAALMFKAGEPAWLVDPNGANGEEVRIASVLNNTVTLGPKTITNAKTTNPFTENPHVAGALGTGTYILPKQETNNVLIVYEDGSAGPWLYIGSGPLFTVATPQLIIYKIGFATTGTQPPYWNAGQFSPGNPIESSELFVAGTTSDTYFTVLSIA
jgi:hypothetical protein